MLPDAYRLTLQTMLEDQSTVTGRAEINLHAEEPTYCVIMHAVAMSIDFISIISSEGSAQQGALYSDRCSRSPLRATCPTPAMAAAQELSAMQQAVLPVQGLSTACAALQSCEQLV